MAVPWLLVLKSVPWSTVIKSAPKVAEGAKKLWNSVGKNDAQDITPVWLDEPPAAGDDRMAALQDRLGRTQAAVKDLHQQMQASAELIKQLADQNTMLIVRIEQNRLRLKWLTVATAVLGLLALGQLVRLLVS
jgi:hypothetical protein